MATSSMARLSRSLYRSVISNTRFSSCLSVSFSSKTSSPSDVEDTDISGLESDTEFVPESRETQSSAKEQPQQQKTVYDRPLEDGLDVGVYKAIIVGQVGQTPVQKTLKSGVKVTLLSVGTGGIRNNRRPLDDEDPREYANRCSVQWHRVSVYPQGLGDIVMKHATPGSTVYLEGNLETKIFNDPATGLVRRIREIAIRRNGRLIFLGKGVDSHETTQGGFKGVGYY